MRSILEHVRYRMAQMVRQPGRGALISIETVLLLLSMAYGMVMRIRALLYRTGVLPSKRLPCRVVSIGNITAGGTGKTPMTIMVANSLRNMGFRVVVISRGYRGKMESTGGIVSDGQTIYEGPETAGDEPTMMARVLKGIPVVVGRSRHKVGMMAVKRFRPDVILLDDAFQHLNLQRDLDIVLLDSQSPYGNGYVLPRGLLREPISALARADAIVFTRSDPNVIPRIDPGLVSQLPVCRTAHTPIIRMLDAKPGIFLTHSTDLSILNGKRVVAFVGLADNDQFFDVLRQAGCIIEKGIAFADHHRYSSDDVDRIASVVRQIRTDYTVTSFKDYVKVEKWEASLQGLVVVDVVIQMVENEETFHQILSEIMIR